MRNVLGVLGVMATMVACSGGGGTFIVGAGGSGPAPGDAPSASASDDDSAAKDDGKTVPASVTAKLATDLTISEIAVFQGVKATIVKGTAKATPGVPLVAQRDALVRVYVKPSSSYEPRSLKAVLRLVDADGTPLKAITDTKKLSAASTDESLASTFDFEVPGSSLPLGVQFAVAITDETADPIDEGEDSHARYPADGSETSLGVKSSGPSLRIVIVPIKYAADGSGRLPDTGAAQLQLDRDVTWAMYPIPKVDITVRSQPYVWNRTVSGSGQGWSELLQSLVDLREQDGADDDVYYWGAFASASSQQAFCGGGCVLGLSTVVSDPRNAYFRASIGVGYHGSDSAETMAHEIGHAHGRDHAPCSDFGQIDGVDPSFPHQGAELGAWGYDLVHQTLMDPVENRDFMGYCHPAWISDYTYQGLFDRLSAVNKGKPLPPVDDSSGSGGASGAAYQFVTIGADGPASFGKHVRVRSPLHGAPREVQLLDANGKTKRVVRGDFFAFDHLPGGLLMIPDDGAPYAGVRVNGYRRTLTR
jgi:hypothetical protein